MYTRADAFSFPPPNVHPALKETLPNKADRIALAHEIATSTLANLVSSESGWNPDSVGDNGCSYGLTQQNICAHPEITKEMALDPETALTIAARDIAAHKEDKYTVCNCWAYLSTQIKNLPRMKDITPNSTPKIGAVAIFLYKDKQTGETVKHVALVAELSDTSFVVKETNFTHCLYDKRVIDKNDPHLVGFWNK